MSRHYVDCSYCGGEVVEETGVLDLEIGGEIKLIEDVPLGVCRQCREKFLHGTVAEMVDRVLAGEAGPPRKVEVLSFRYRNLDQAA